MEAGLNSDIQVGSKHYHVQTEDWGWDNPFIVTKIFCQGAVLRSYKIPYQDIFKNPFAGRESIRQALENQHQQILDRLLSSQLE